MLLLQKIQLLVVITTTILIIEGSCGITKRNRDRDPEDDDDSSASSSTEQALTPVRIKSGGIGVFPDYSKRLEGLHGALNDPISSSQNISPAIAGYSQYNNPFLLNGQSNLQNNAALLYQNGGLGGAGLGGLQNQFGGGIGGLGGLNNFQGQQNQYNLAALQQALLLQQQQQQQGGQLGQFGGLGVGGFGGGGLYNGAGGDLYSQQAGLTGVNVGLSNGGLYNPLLGGGLGTNGYLGQTNLGGLSGLGGVGVGGIGGLGSAGGIGGINPYLLGGRTGGLGFGAGNYLAQSLLSPYNSYNQINPYSSYPFSARFGIGRGSTSGSSSGRINTSSSTNNDE